MLALATMPSGDVPAACDGLRTLVGAADGLDVVVCDVGELKADLVTVEVLVRLRLTAGRLGCRLVLRGVSRELAELLAFCGLSAGLGWRGRKPEEGEQARGVEERVDRADPPI